MPYIAVLSVIAIVLLQMSGAVPNSSVGGALTLALVFFAAAIAVGMHEAWTKRRGVLGWIVSIVVSIVGGFLAAEVGNLLVLPILVLVQALGLAHIDGSLAATGGLVLYASLAAMMLLMILGSWLALQLVSRWR